MYMIERTYKLSIVADSDAPLDTCLPHCHAKAAQSQAARLRLPEAVL